MCDLAGRCGRLLCRPERCHGVNLPTSSPPVVRTSRVGVLGCIAMLLVDHHPTHHHDLVAQQSSTKVGGRPIFTLGRHGGAHPRTDLNNHVMSAIRIPSCQCELDVCICMFRIFCQAIDRFGTARFTPTTYPEIIAPCVTCHRVASFPGAKTADNEIAGSTWVLNGVAVRFFKRLSAMSAGLVVWPSSGHPSKLPAPCP
jgi:hypothetical protein